MTVSYTVDFSQIIKLAELNKLGKTINTQASRALNSTASKTRTKSSKIIRQQIAFKARYLSGESGKITQKKKASANNLVTSLGARSRPTSLAHFAVSRSRRRGAGVKVRVKPASVRHMKKAFFVNLRAGSADGGNLGLAVRSDTKPHRAYRPKKLGKNLWLLYGPSVAQALINARQSGVWPDIEAEVGVELEAEFARLMAVFGPGGTGQNP